MGKGAVQGDTQGDRVALLGMGDRRTAGDPGFRIYRFRAITARDEPDHPASRRSAHVKPSYATFDGRRGVGLTIAALAGETQTRYLSGAHSPQPQPYQNRYTAATRIDVRAPSPP